MLKLGARLALVLAFAGAISAVVLCNSPRVASASSGDVCSRTVTEFTAAGLPYKTTTYSEPCNCRH